MNIVLLNPKLKTWSPNIYVPLGLAYIAASLEHAGYSVKITDLNSHKVSDSKLQEGLVGADVIGITGMVTEYQEVLRLTGIARGCNPKAKIILGGPLATTHTNKVLSTSQADCVVMGEGERTIVELVSAIEQGIDYSEVKGIAYKSDGLVNVSPVREPTKNLDDILYPARHLLDMNRYTTHHFKSFGMKVPRTESTTLISSRGCPFNCTFCHKDMWGYKWRSRSSDNIIGEIRQLNRDYGFNGFVFNDDTFVLNNERVKDFCNKLIDKKIDINWYCNGRVNLMAKELLELMYDAGCKGIAYGIESGNQEILDSIKKGITLEQVREVVEWTKEADIHITGYFMLGILGDTKATIGETVKFARELDLNFYGFAMTSPIIGTSMYTEAQKKGLIIENNLEDWSFHASVNLTKDCSKKELERLNEDVFREFTIQKRYGKYYLLNPFLWLNGLRSVVFLYGKRDYKELLRKVWGLIFKQ